jgi:hypothetical protein
VYWREMSDMSAKDKEREYIFTLNEPQIRIIFNAIEHYASSTLLDFIEITEKEGDKETVEQWNKDEDIASNLHEFFQGFYFLIQGMPEGEPVLECKTILKHAKRNWEEQKEHRERIERLDKLAYELKKKKEV